MLDTILPHGQHCRTAGLLGFHPTRALCSPAPDTSITKMRRPKRVLFHYRSSAIGVEPAMRCRWLIAVHIATSPYGATCCATSACNFEAKRYFRSTICQISGDFVSILQDLSHLFRSSLGCDGSLYCRRNFRQGMARHVRGQMAAQLKRMT